MLQCGDFDPIALPIEQEPSVVDEYHDNMLKIPLPIEQELEARLEKRGNYYYKATDGLINRKPVTRIYLPVYKYEEFVSRPTRERVNADGTATFHDIPVYSYSGDSIHFCTD